MQESAQAALSYTRSRAGKLGLQKLPHRGESYPIGGLKEKSLAALRVKINTVIVPAKNRKDVEEILPYIRRKLRYIFVDIMDEVLDIALVKTKKINLQKKMIQKQA